MRVRPYLCLLVVGALATGCQDHSNTSSAASPDDTTTPASAGVIDSALPMDVLLDRFRRDVPKVEQLRTDVATRDELVHRVVAAMAAGDTAALERSAVNVNEYAWLFFPTTRIARPPYEVPPALAWFQVQEKNRRGALRALRELGGHRVTLLSYRCDPNPTIEDQNRLWTGCVATIARDDQPAVEIRLFGTILERGGRFEVVSYENDF